MKAINSKYQTLVNRVLTADRKVSDVVDSNQRELDLVSYDSPKYYRLEEKHVIAEDKAHNRLNDLWEQLPKREQINFNKQYKAQFGYDCYAF